MGVADRVAARFMAAFDERAAKRLDPLRYVKVDDYDVDSDIGSVTLDFDARRFVGDLRKLGFEGNENDITLRVFFGNRLVTK